MTLDILIYRMHRLWKVAALGAILPLATVWAASAYHNADFPVLFVLAILVPTLHALRYPGMWLETLTVALVLAPCLWLAAMLEPGLTAGEVLWRIFWLGVMALILFFLLVTPMAWLALIGPRRVLTARASQISPLDKNSLRKALAFMPDQSTETRHCGPTDDDGRFPVTLHLQPIDQVKFEIRDDLVLDGPDAPEPLDEDEPASPSFHAFVHSTGPDHHELFTFTDREDVGVQRIDFDDLAGGGTRVSIQETGHRLTYGQIFGFWLTDFMADYLTHELELAEGQRPRANRAFPQRQMVVDIANLILPMLGGTRVDQQADKGP